MIFFFIFHNIYAFVLKTPSFTHKLRHLSSPPFTGPNQLYLSHRDLSEQQPIIDSLYEGDEERLEDEDLVLEMAVQQFDDLRGNDALVTKEQFLQWDDIVDLVSNGTMDESTVNAIFDEVSYHSPSNHQMSWLCNI